MCAFDFVDRTRDVFVLDECLIGGIVEDDGVIFLSVVYPGSKLLACGRGSCRVVRVAEVDDVYFFFWDGWDEVVFSGAGEIDESVVTAVFISFASVTDHYVGVNVDWVDWVGDGDFVVLTEDV